MATFTSWADLLAQANQNRQKNYEGNYIDGTYINGLPAQLQYGADGGINGINWYGAQGNPGYNMSLAPNADGSVNEQWYKENNSLPWGAFAVLGAPFLASALGAGAGGAGAAEGAGWTSGYDLAGGGALGDAGGLATSGAGGLAGTAASGAGEDFLSSIGIAPGSVSAAVPATSADFASMGIGDLVGGSSAASGLGAFLGSKGGAALAGGLLSGISSLSAPKSTTATSTQQIDPRMASILYGDGTAQNPGFLNRALQVANQPQNAGMAAFGNGMANYLGSNGMGAFNNSMNTAQSLQGSNIGAPTAQAAQVNAPGQNNMNLSPAYQQMIYGDSAQNPYLTGALQKGVNQANTAFGNMAHDYGQALQDNLAGIRGGAIVNGAMGSSRQGIAEGKAFDGYNTGMSRALSQYGQNVTDNIMGAQANAYESGQNRALSAMSGLGAQQYGVAGQNASMQQQANLANLQSQLSTNALNSENQRAGVGLTSGLLGQASGYGQNQDSYNMNKLGQVGGLLSPFTGLNNTTSQTQPLYQNTAGNVLGGALAGAQIWKAFQ